jgi:anthranilate/para-aminobenzoate synthase component I
VRHGATPSAGDLSPGILTHGAGLRALTLADPVDPVAALAALGGRARPALIRHGGVTVVAADPDEVATGADAWDALAGRAERRPPGTAMAGGWIGMLAYDLGGTVERLPAPHPDPGGPPLAALGRYPTVAAIDDDGRCTIASTGSAADLHDLARVVAGAPPPAPLDPPARRAVTSSLPAGAYREAVEAARELIRAGDCYQVNLAQRLTAGWDEGPLAFARRLWGAAGPAPRRAYLGLPEGAAVSASPELLVSLRDGLARSEPIKGTAPPGRSAELRASAKDRAEHVMIVDLVRNDLGRVARPGGVRVARLLDALRTPYVEHMVSEVVAELAPGLGPADVLRATFPGGSVTGCPKVRAMEVIRELEPVGRGPAFGSMVALGADGSLEASVAIRTAWHAGDEVRYWCGGAVVWDSDPEAERAEAWAKARPFLGALGPAGAPAGA